MLSLGAIGGLRSLVLPHIRLPAACLTAAISASANMPVMSELQSSSARETAKAESKHNFEVLQREGLLGIKRAVTIIASPLVPGSGPVVGKKVVHLIRHGQGFHNLLADLWRDFGRTIDPMAKGEGAADVNPYDRPEVLDPPLTTIGRKQAQALQPYTKDLAGLELVVVSPVRRATETALLAFAHLLASKSGSAVAAVPFVGHEDCAERRHANVCDKRRSLSEIKAEFPMVDWSLVTSEEDPLFSDTEPEPWRSASDRGHAFLLWLRERPEQEIAVASHSAWLFALLNTAVECTEPELKEWFLTGELRSVVLEFVEEDVARLCAKRPRLA